MNRIRLVKLPCGFITALLALGVLQATASPLNEAKVFDWWDNGIISAEEATEILDLLEEGNQEEACLLAQVYAQESCEEPPTPKGKSATSRKNMPKSPRRPSLAPHGYVDWKGRIDSTGHLFYRYTLRLGSQELLAYKNQGSEAYFGDISTRELHSQIPLDTLWGTALLYPLGNFHAAGLLDTAKTTQVRLGYGKRGTATIEAFYWHGFGDGDVHSLGLQTKMPFAQMAAWWQYGQEFPLIKIQFYGSEKRDRSNQMKDGMESAAHPIIYSWRTTAYIHREYIPRWARLSNTIQKSKYWGSQSLSMLPAGGRQRDLPRRRHQLPGDGLERRPQREPLGIVDPGSIHSCPLRTAQGFRPTPPGIFHKIHGFWTKLHEIHSYRPQGAPSR